MRVVITGGAGFVGLAAADALLSAGHFVILADCRQPDPRLVALLPGGGEQIAICSLDICDEAALGKALADHRVSHLLHAAALTPDPAEEAEIAERLIAVNVLGTISVIKAAARANLSRVVLVSSGAVYEGSGDVPCLAENSPGRPQTLYAASKVAAETAALTLARTYEVDLAIVRLGAVFGPYEHETGVRATLSPIFRVTSAARAGRGVSLAREGSLDWIYSADAGAGLAGLLGAKTLVNRIYNLSGTSVWSVEDWCQGLVQIYSGFRFKLPETSVSEYVEVPESRAQLAVDRLQRELVSWCTHDFSQAMNAYLAWLDLARARA